ncbi:MAG: phosphoenolpyruvate carboxykinase (GTP) [Candidatus Marinimicrobia bacterium]|nr:phosphoenolpyruvate carboxykinase (GTP) [Candidatus Neomarinimicrobiota bacterium]
MLKLRHGMDILSEIGGIQSFQEASEFLQTQCDPDQYVKLQNISDQHAILEIANAVSMMEPESIFINTGSQEDRESIRRYSLEQGEEEPLAINRHTIHYDLPEEQARIVDRTFYIVNEDERASSMAQKIQRLKAHEYIKEHMRGIAKNMTLFIGFYIRGPVGAKASIPALEISTSAYVMHSANILYRNAYDHFDSEAERAGNFFTNIHSQGPNRPENLPDARVFMDRSWFTTFSMYCTYAGNTLLLKKGNHRFAVDLATYYKKEDELSEHMFITGMTGDDGRKTYMAGAAPSGCGKTTTAMVGTDFIGDDLAQLWIADDGTLRAINPENGVFSIVRDVSWDDDPHLMRVLREEGEEVIFSNVLVDENGMPHWTGQSEEIPAYGVNFQGEWAVGKTDIQAKLIPPSHPNARATLACSAIDNYNAGAAEDPAGVEIKVITYSGRDSDTMPPLVVAKNPDHGVVFGASILSATTATEMGVSGVRRQPWANEPFIPGPLSEYMQAQFAFFNSEKLVHKPVIANLNYFLTHAARGGKGNDLLGEKSDVHVWLSWLEQYAHADVPAIETPIGFIPEYADLEILFRKYDKVYTRELYERQFALYIDNIIARIDLQEEAYSQSENIPEKLFEIYEEQRAGLLALKNQYGPVASVNDLFVAA